MRIVQYAETNGERRVGLVAEDGDHAFPLAGARSVYELAVEAAERGGHLADLVRARATDLRVDYAALLRDGRVLAPLDHPEPSRLLVTGKHWPQLFEVQIGGCRPPPPVGP